ncbi:hypothetical protein G6M04_14360 [Agrobacterium rhizogenes]|uniref:phage tail length tape measure family protein n=1 Tax=Rhizobium rhizogenes TaxID=359 RepID=UPI0015722A09|nr:phage tail length tape measure family protein [Rhizobium rhizogenes]NTG48572.1 hypothetical protein [Rhizobium rhizogenes]
MTEARLGFAIDSSQAAGAASDLDRLTASSSKAEQAANKVSIAATKASRGFGDISPTLDRIIAGLTRLEATARSIDQRLAAMAKSAQNAAAANRSLAETTTSVQSSQSKGTSAATQAAAAIDRQRQATERLNAAQRASSRAPTAANQNRGAQSFQTANVAAQFQDIAVTSAMGMSPLQIALQQGTQLSAVLGPMGATGAVKGLAAAFMSVISPVSLVTLALVGGAAAAIQYFSSAGKESKTLEKLLDEQVAAIKRIKDVWGEAATARSQYGRESSGSASFGLETNISEMTKKLREANAPTTFGPGAVASSVTGAINNNIGATGLTARQFRETNLFKTLTIDFQQLQKATVEGKPDVLSLVSSLEDIGRSANNAGIKAIAQDAVAALQPFKDLAQAIRDAEVERRRLFDSVGPNGMALSQGLIAQADSNQSAIYESRNRVAAERQRKALDAQIMGVNARSPAEREAAAQASAAAVYNNDENPAQRKQRIDDAAQISRVQSEKQLADAARDRAMNLDKVLQDQQTDISLIGKTGGAAAALRKEYELTSALRMEAARQGIDVDQKELEVIKQKSAELGKLTDIYNQTRFSFDINQQNSDAQLSPRDRQIVQTQRQYGLSENVNDANGQAIGKQLDWQDAKNTAKQFGSAFSNELISGSHNIGKAFLKGFQTSIENGAQKLWEKLFDGVGTTFANWITGSKGLAGTQATAASGIGAIGTKIFGGSNSSKSNAAASAIPSTDIASYITQAAIKRGIDPSTALAVAKSEGGLDSWNKQSGVFKNGVQEPSFGPFQLYKGGGLGNVFQKKTGLDPAVAANGPAGVDFALDHASKNGWGSWYGAKNTGISNWQGIGANSNVGGAADAVSKLAENSKAAAANVGTFGNGLGQLGTSLGSNSFPAAPQSSGGGGIFGWLGGLFGGSKSSQWNLAAAGKLKPGLFASGTNYAPGGPAIVGENGPELLDLPQGSQVTSNHKLMSALAANSNQPQQSSRTMMVNVQGASGDDHVRTLVQQGVGAALSDYNTQQRRGGVGVLQARYSNQKV